MNLTVARTDPIFSLRSCSVHPGPALDAEPQLQVFKRARVAAAAVLGTRDHDHDQQRLQEARAPPRPYVQPSTTSTRAGPIAAMLTNVSRSNRQRIRALFDAAAHAHA